MTVVGQNAKLLEFTSTVPEPLVEHLDTLSTVKNSTVADKVKQALAFIGNGIKTVSIALVSVLLQIVKFVFNLFDDLIQLGVNVLSTVFYAVTEILWFVLTFTVTVPFVSDLYAVITGGSKISLLSLILLPTAAVATWYFILI